MNYMGNSGSSTSGRRQQGRGGGGGGGGDGGGYSFEEDDEEEKEQSPAAGQLLFPSSSSPSPSPSSSHHHQYQYQYHHQPLLHPPPYQHQHQCHHHHGGGGWLVSTGQGGESSSRLEPMMLDPSPMRSAADDADRQHQHGLDDEEPPSHHQSAAGEGGGGGGIMMMVEREHMFDKVVTPSDVGKLNRLVIPKQHAERYFPLDSSTNDKGLLLNFEDRNGKPWRFRYSYWNSSQSYVMTKGWSRFVKEKKLDAGDIVSFQRGVGGSAKDRLFIDWRRRPDAPTPPQLSNLPFPHHHHFSSSSFHNSRNSINIHPWNPNPLFLQSQAATPPIRSRSNLMLQPLSGSSYPYGGSSGPYNIGTGSVVNVMNQGGSGSVIYFRSAAGGGGGGGGSRQQVEAMHMQQKISGGEIDPPGAGAGAGAASASASAAATAAVVYESVPVVHGKAAAKRLRLFGVNMDCPISEDDEDYDPSELSPTSAASTTTMPMGHYNANSYHDNFPHPPPVPPPPLSSSSSTIPYLQLRPYEGTPFHETTAMSSSDALNKTKPSSSNMSLDLDI